MLAFFVAAAAFGTKDIETGTVDWKAEYYALLDRYDSISMSDKYHLWSPDGRDWYAIDDTGWIDTTASIGRIRMRLEDSACEAIFRANNDGSIDIWTKTECDAPLPRPLIYRPSFKSPTPTPEPLNVRIVEE